MRFFKNLMKTFDRGITHFEKRVEKTSHYLETGEEPIKQEKKEEAHPENTMQNKTWTIENEERFYENEPDPS